MAIDGAVFKALKDRAAVRRRNCDTVREALNSSAPLLDHDAWPPADKVDDAWRDAALQFAPTLQKPSLDLLAAWQAQVVSPMQSLDASLKAQDEFADLEKAQLDLQDAQRHVQTCAEQKESASMRLMAALQREEKSSHSFLKSKQKKRSVERDTAAKAQADSAQLHQDALEQLDECQERCAAKTVAAIDGFLNDERAYRDRLREVVSAAALSLESWAGSSQDALAQRGRHSIPGDAAEVPSWLEATAEPSTSSTSQPPLFSFHAGVGRTTSAGILKEAPADPWFIEDRAKRLNKENEALAEKLPIELTLPKLTARLRQHQQLDDDPSTSSPPSEAVLQYKKKENDARESTLRAQRTSDLSQQLHESAYHFENQLSTLERLARVCTDAARAAAQATAATPSTVTPSPASDVAKAACLQSVAEVSSEDDHDFATLASKTDTLETATVEEEAEENEWPVGTAGRTLDSDVCTTSAAPVTPRSQQASPVGTPRSRQAPEELQPKPSTPRAGSHQEVSDKPAGTPRTPRKGLADKLRALNFTKSKKHKDDHHAKHDSKPAVAASAASLANEEAGTPRGPSKESEELEEAVWPTAATPRGNEEAEPEEASWPLGTPRGQHDLGEAAGADNEATGGSQSEAAADLPKEVDISEVSEATEVQDAQEVTEPPVDVTPPPVAQPVHIEHAERILQDARFATVITAPAPMTLESQKPVVEEALTDDEWRLFAFEMLLLGLAACMVMSTAALESSSRADDMVQYMTLAASLCRVRSGIPSQVHQQLVELIFPDADSTPCSVFDVRYRAFALFRSWVRSESDCFFRDGGSEAEQEVMIAWVVRQIKVLRCCVLHRIAVLQRQNSKMATTVGKACLSRLAALQRLADPDRWGAPNMPEEVEPGGRRLLVLIIRDLDTLRPQGSLWRFHRLMAAQVFRFLWAGAADPHSEDGLNIEGPIVAAALLSGLHQHVGTPPLSMETHAALLAQQVWLAICPHDALAPALAVYVPGCPTLPASSLQSLSRIMADFSDWLKSTPINGASCFAQSRDIMLHDDHEDTAEEEPEIRKIVLSKMQEGFEEKLGCYRASFEPDAFAPALAAYCMLRRLTDASAYISEADESPPNTGRGSNNGRSITSDNHKTAAKMGRDVSSHHQELRETLIGFTWHSVLAVAKHQIQPFLQPELVENTAEAWTRKGPTIKKHMDALADSIGILKEELDCVRDFYLKGAEEHLNVNEHLGACAAALCVAVRPAVEALIQSQMWPKQGAAILEIPPGGGRVLSALEELDRLSRVYPEPELRNSPITGNTTSIIEMLSAQVIAAMKVRFNEIDQDIVARALAGNTDDIFKPLRPPNMLHCESVVSLWSFVHHALDAQLSLGIPIDLVCAPFVFFLTPVIQRAIRVLASPAEKAGAFRLGTRATQVMSEVMKLKDEVLFSGDESGQDSAPELYGKQKHAVSAPNLADKPNKERGAFKWAKKMVGARTSEDMQRNIITEAALLMVENPAALTAPVHQVLVRLSSIAFCCKELRTLREKLLDAVNGGDCSLKPSQRNAEARVLICEELPDLSDELEHNGLELCSYLAHRIVYIEMQKDLFQQLYFPPMQGGKDTTPSNNNNNNSNASVTPRGGGGSGAGENSLREVEGNQVVVLEDILAQCQDKMLSLISQVPAHFLVRFIVQLSTQLTHAWLFVVLDYCRKGKRDQVEPYLDDDQEALRQLLGLFADEATSRAKAEASSGSRVLSNEDCIHIQEQLNDVQKVVGVLCARVSTCSIEQLIRYSAGVFQEQTAGTPRDGPRGSSPIRAAASVPAGTNGGETPRLSATPRGATPRGTTPRGVSPRGRGRQPGSPTNGEDGADERGRKKPHWKVGSKLKGMFRH